MEELDNRPFYSLQLKLVQQARVYCFGVISSRLAGQSSSLFNFHRADMLVRPVEILYLEMEMLLFCRVLSQYLVHYHKVIKCDGYSLISPTVYSSQTLVVQ